MLFRPVVRDAGEEVRIDHEVAVSPVVLGRGLGSDDFIPRFTLLLQRRHVVSDTGQHVAEGLQVRLGSHGPVPWNDHGLVADLGQDRIEHAHHAADAPAVFVVDERIDAVPEQIAEEDHVRRLHRDVEVGIRMRRWHGDGGDRLLVELPGLGTLDDDRGNARLRQRLEGVIPVVHARGFRYALLRTGACRYFRAGCSQPRITVGMVPVVVRVDDIAQRQFVDGFKGGVETRFRHGDARVDHELAVRAADHADVATGTGKHGDAIAHLRALDLRGRRRFIDLDDGTDAFRRLWRGQGGRRHEPDEGYDRKRTDNARTMLVAHGVSPWLPRNG